MRVLFAVYPSHAHLWPIVPCASALQSAGHEVRVATHASFARSVVATGLTPVALGNPDDHEPRMRPDANSPKHPADVLRFADVLGLDEVGREHWIAFYQWLLAPISDFVRTDLPEAGDLIDFARTWRPDLVLWDPTFASGPVAARACGAAHARTLMGPDYFAWSMDRLAERRGAAVAAGLPENPQLELVAPLADKYGIELDDELAYGQWTLDPLPPGISLPTSATTVPMRYVPYTGAEVLPKWLYAKPERPRVALTLGESVRRFIKGDWGRTPKILEAVADLDIEVIATLNDLQLEGVERVPDNVRVIEWVSLTQLLPTCSAIIHHGGMGTFGASWALRIPQIVCDTGETLLLRPDEEGSDEVDSGTYRIGWEFGVREETEEKDKVTNWKLPGKKLEASLTAGYVVGRGAGTRLNHVTQSVEDIGKLILEVLNEPSYQQGAAAAGNDWLGRPSPADAVGLLEKLTLWNRRR